MKRLWITFLLVNAWWWFIPDQHARADEEESPWIASRVTTLAARYRQLPTTAHTPSWTSPAGQILFFDLLPATGQPGFGAEFLHRFSAALQQRGVTVVEAEILAQVIRELRLTPEQLADEAVQLGLAASAEAKIVILPDASAAPHPGALVKDVSDEAPLLRLCDQSGADEEERAAAWADQVADLVQRRYPLRGRILHPDAGEVIIDLGTRHGVRAGMVFNVLGDGVPIDLADGVAEFQYEWLGRIRVTRTETALSFATPEARSGLWNKAQKITAAW